MNYSIKYAESKNYIELYYIEKSIFNMFSVPLLKTTLNKIFVVISGYFGCIKWGRSLETCGLLDLTGFAFAYYPDHAGVQGNKQVDLLTS